jgi:hypothetical protein
LDHLALLGSPSIAEQLERTAELPLQRKETFALGSGADHDFPFDDDGR